MQIAIAVLTVLQAHRQAPPVSVKGGADYHEWTEVVRKPIVWLQQQGLTEAAGIGKVTDPAMALGVESTVANPEQLGLQQLLEGLEGHIECNKPFQAKDLHAWYVAGEDRRNEAEASIRDGIENLTAGKVPTPRSLGYVLMNKRGRYVAGLRLANVATDRNGVIWQVRRD
jgi:hypothetical protein